MLTDKTCGAQHQGLIHAGNNGVTLSQGLRLGRPACTQAFALQGDPVQQSLLFGRRNRQGRLRYG